MLTFCVSNLTSSKRFIEVATVKYNRISLLFHTLARGKDNSLIAIFSVEILSSGLIFVFSLTRF